jgi:GxxExxY protein
MQPLRKKDLPGEVVDRLARQVIGAAIEVHRTLGPGYLESVYEQALCIQLAEQAIPYRSQHTFSVLYHDQPVGTGYVDLMIDSALVVELKSVESLADVHQAQLLSYLKATRCRLGLLINFNVSVLKDGIRRLAL